MTTLYLHLKGRIFLTPENPETYKQRKRAGGNKKRSYTEGWVEFVSKRDAKAAAELLNARTIGDGIGGKKGVGRFYKDDHWNLVYLRSFKWSHLIEQVCALPDFPSFRTGNLPLRAA